MVGSRVILSAVKHTCTIHHQDGQCNVMMLVPQYDLLELNGLFTAHSLTYWLYNFDEHCYIQTAINQGIDVLQGEGTGIADGRPQKKRKKKKQLPGQLYDILFLLLFYFIYQVQIIPTPALTCVCTCTNVRLINVSNTLDNRNACENILRVK